MAQPIRATTPLVGNEAIRFLDKMKKRNKMAPSKVDAELIDLLKVHSKYLQV